jgi:hypothetical protein
MQKHNLNKEHIMTEVYSYPFTEVRKVLEPYDFQPPLELTANINGELDLDEIHIPIINRIKKVQMQHMPGIESFDNAYPMAGSSQSMFTLMAEWKAKGSMESLAVLEGEYEGYKAYADSLQIPISTYDTFPGVKKDGEIWFVSNPSARDGNWIEDKQWQDFVDTGHHIVYDAAYVGLTTEVKKIDVSAQNIKAVLTSPSKIFGVFRNRNTGVTYTREPVDALYGSKWFKDVPALLASLSLYEKFGNNELPKKYKKAQQFICSQLTDLVGLDVSPSDVLLLANAQGQTFPEYRKFERIPGYRFGLTKLFEDYEKTVNEEKSNGL